MLETKRLLLRQWCEDDLAQFAAMNADPDVMRYYPATLTSAESDAMAKKIQTLIAERGWGFWAVERKEQPGFIGFVGLHQPQVILPCSPCTEVGWRLAKDYWGKGYATEAANAALQFGFQHLRLTEIAAFTAVLNEPSKAVMERLHMLDTGQNFAHPDVPVDSVLREHLLYKMTRKQWYAINE